MRPRTPRRDHGFSFIELLAYMAIAALLILAAVPQFNGYRAKAAISNLQGDLRNAATDMEAKWQDSQSYPRALPDTVKVSRGTTLTVDRLISDADKMDALIDACRAYGWSCTWDTGSRTLILAFRTDGGWSTAWLPSGTPFRAVDTDDHTAVTGFAAILRNAGLSDPFTIRDYSDSTDSFCVYGTNDLAQGSTWHYSSAGGGIQPGGC